LKLYCFDLKANPIKRGYSLPEGIERKTTNKKNTSSLWNNTIIKKEDDNLLFLIFEKF